jgi:hypothetical protein
MKHSKYYIKLGSHITEKKYGKTDSNAIYGTRQGSGCSPHIWTLISSQLFSVYMEESQSFRITESYNGAASQMHVTAYMDDVHTHHSFIEGVSASHMIRTETKLAQRWSDILYVSGGKLSNEKCNYYAVMWTGRSKVTQMEYPSTQLEGTDGYSVYVKNVTTAQCHKSLGYFQSMENSVTFQ